MEWGVKREQISIWNFNFPSGWSSWTENQIQEDEDFDFDQLLKFIWLTENVLQSNYLKHRSLNDYPLNSWGKYILYYFDQLE